MTPVSGLLGTTGPVTRRRLLETGARRLFAAGVPTARLDAEVLLAWALGADRSALHVHPERAVGEREAAAFESTLRQRCERVPLAYAVGTKEFWSLDFEVTPDVLIPRPETERIVELALDLAAGSGITRRGRSTARNFRPSICDMGTGSGCIAVALARELPCASVTAVDISPAALAVAQRNARRHGVEERIELVQGDLFASLSGRCFDLVVSNPPYVATAEFAALEPELRYEPAIALAGGADGLDVIRRLVAASPGYLAPGGWLLLEVSATRAATVAGLARASGLTDVRVVADHAGLPRVVMARVD